jgi:hypothetical protein
MGNWTISLCLPSCFTLLSVIIFLMGGVAG